MTKCVFLAIWLNFGLIFTLDAQITNAFGQIGTFYNANDDQLTFREHRVWLQTAVGLSLKRNFAVGIRMNQLWRSVGQEYSTHLWEGGPFFRAKWNLREYYYLYAELGIYRGNICSCGELGSPFIIRKNGLHHLSFAHGFSLKFSTATYFYTEVYWNFILDKETVALGFLNASIGLRHYLRESSFRR